MQRGGLDEGGLQAEWVCLTHLLEPGRPSAGHRNSRTTVYAHGLILERWRAGWLAARIAEQLGISRATVHKWIARFREGWAEMEDN